MVSEERVDVADDNRSFAHRQGLSQKQGYQGISHQALPGLLQRRQTDEGGRIQLQEDECREG